MMTYRALIELDEIRIETALEPGTIEDYATTVTYQGEVIFVQPTSGTAAAVFTHGHLTKFLTWGTQNALALFESCEPSERWSVDGYKHLIC